MPKRAANRLRIVGLRVHELCEPFGWNADDLSHGAWISPETARKLFTNSSVDPTLSTAIPVARALGTYIEDLIILAPDETLPGSDVPRPPRRPQLQCGTFTVQRLRIREECEALGLTADDLARKGGVNFSTTRGLFYGHTIDPTLSTIVPLARAIGKHIEELVEAQQAEDTHWTPRTHTGVAA